MSKGHVLIIDDEPTLLEACEETLSYHGYDVRLQATARDGVESVRQETFDLVLIDLRIPDTDGLHILREIRSIDENVMAIMITGFPTIATAVEAVKEGAFDYLPKPFTPDQLLIVVDRALSQKRLAEENLLLRKTLRFRRGFEGMVGKSRAMERVMDLVEKVADSDVSVVIEGETGTGKELVARSLHRNSSRHDRPFLPINCGALPENLLESELFGHERGAFTGAHTRKPGLLETAQEGTVFLDEISALSPNLQVKLLRVLQDRQVRRVGGQELIDITIRVISATNENLEQMVADGRFRDDLYYRLNVITIPLPPLRERVEDIPLLTEHVLKNLNSEHEKHIQGISKETMDLLQGYAWPGNVRELQNVIERAFFLTDAEEITPLDLPAHLTRQETLALSVDTQLPFPQAKRAYLEPFEQEYLAKLLLGCGGNVSRAAERAQVHRSSFQRLLKKHGIRPRDYRGA